MSDFQKLNSYEAFRDPNSGAVVFTGSRGYKQAVVRRKIVEERQKEQELIRNLSRVVADLQTQIEILTFTPPPEA